MGSDVAPICKSSMALAFNLMQSVVWPKPDLDIASSQSTSRVSSSTFSRVEGARTMGVRPATLSYKVVRGSQLYGCLPHAEAFDLDLLTAASMTLGSWHLYLDGAIVDAVDI